MKNLILIFTVLFFIVGNVFGQKAKVSDKQAIEKIKIFYCDCYNTVFKDFSTRFNKIFDKMAKEIRITSKITITPLQKYLEKNKVELEKFEKITDNSNKN